MKRLALIAALTACSAPTEPVASFTSQPNPHMIVGIGSHGSPNEGAIMQGMNLHHVRVSYYANDDSQQYRAEFALRIADLESHGLEVLIVVPDCDERSSNCFSVLTHFATSPAFAHALMQPGNEWDAYGYTGTQYAGFMRKLAALGVNMQRVVSMGLASTDGTPLNKTPDWKRQAQFFDDYFRAGGPLLRAFAIHCYGASLHGAVADRMNSVDNIIGGRAPIWITETGMDSVWSQQAGPMHGAALDEWQEQQTQSALETAREEGAERVYVYQLVTKEDAKSATQDNYGFGVLRADAKTERPVVNVLRNWRTN